MIYSMKYAYKAKMDEINAIYTFLPTVDESSLYEGLYIEFIHIDNSLTYEKVEGEIVKLSDSYVSVIDSVTGKRHKSSVKNFVNRIIKHSQK